MRVPVLRGSELRYVLTAVLSPSTLADVVGGEPLPDEWTRAVVDSHGVIVARSRDPARFVGQPGRRRGSRSTPTPCGSRR